MNIDQTKCDYCGKLHDTKDRLLFSDKSKLLSVPIKVKGEKQYMDFCSEDCLREFLVQRQNDKKAKAA